MMKNSIRITVILLLMSAPVSASDFWTKFGERMVSNYARKAGEGVGPEMNQRLTSKQIVSISTKSFSQSFGERIGEIAGDKKPLLLVCAFSREAESCFLDPVIRDTFGEIQLIRKPNVSQKFAKKMARFYTGAANTRESKDARRRRSGLVPPWKTFNPRFGFVMTDMEPVVSTPFYTFAGIYVEPQYGLRKGPSVGFMKDQWFLDVYPNRATLKYSLRKTDDNKKLFGKIMPSISYTSGEGVRLENTVIYW